MDTDSRSGKSYDHLGAFDRLILCGSRSQYPVVRRARYQYLVRRRQPGGTGDFGQRNPPCERPNGFGRLVMIRFGPIWKRLLHERRHRGAPAFHGDRKSHAQRTGRDEFDRRRGFRGGYVILVHLFVFFSQCAEGNRVFLKDLREII